MKKILYGTNNVRIAHGMIFSSTDENTIDPIYVILSNTNLDNIEKGDTETKNLIICNLVTMKTLHKIYGKKLRNVWVYSGIGMESDDGYINNLYIDIFNITAINANLLLSDIDNNLMKCIGVIDHNIISQAINNFALECGVVNPNQSSHTQWHNNPYNPVGDRLYNTTANNQAMVNPVVHSNHPIMNLYNDDIQRSKVSSNDSLYKYDVADNYIDDDIENYTTEDEEDIPDNEIDTNEDRPPILSSNDVIHSVVSSVKNNKSNHDDLSMMIRYIQDCMEHDDEYIKNKYKVDDVQKVFNDYKTRILNS